MTPRPTTSSSNIFRRELCPGSHAAEDGLPEDDSEEAIEGTMLHALSIPGAMLAAAALTPEQHDILERCTDLENEALGRVIAEQQLNGDPFEEGWERELWLYQGMRALYSGHCDYWRYYPARKVLFILDKKFGRGDVPIPTTNLQLRSYAVQGAQEWPSHHVYVAIVQPRLFGPPSLAHYTADDLVAAKHHLIAVWHATHVPDAPRRASADACQYCKATTTCPEYRALVSMAVPLAQLPATRLTNEQLATCLTAIATISDKWVSEIKAEARDRIRMGTLPGFELKPNAARRTITDPRKAFHLLMYAGFTAQELFTIAGLSVGGATELYTRSGRKPKEAKASLELVLGPIIQAKEVEPSIVAA